MSSTLALNSLKAKTLQHLAFLTGLTSSGTKSHLVDHLTVELQRPRLPRPGGRIVSVDMGIRNLAYCVLDTPSSSSSTGTVHVHDWKRLDVLGRLVDRSCDNSNADKSSAAALDKRSQSAKADFSPSVMAAAALDITRNLLSYQPATILIERQRFRSGGGSAIQEWTVRVNMLESMLWACLEATKQSDSSRVVPSFPATHAVSPARVAAFWTAGDDDLLRPSPGLLQGEESGLPELPKRVRGAKKSGKNDKIAVVRSWLQGEGAVALDFSLNAQSQADAFMSTPQSRKRSSKPVDDVSDVAENGLAGLAKTSTGKRDDLADCLLQGVAWHRWEQNRQGLLAALSDRSAP